MNDEPTYEVPVLFEKFKEEFRDLVAVRGLPINELPKAFYTNIFSKVPISNHGEVFSDKFGGGHEKEKEIFRKHGWPSSDYNKTACIAELLAFAAEKWGEHS